MDTSDHMVYAYRTLLLVEATYNKVDDLNYAMRNVCFLDEFSLPAVIFRFTFVPLGNCET